MAERNFSTCSCAEYDNAVQGCTDIRAAPLGERSMSLQSLACDHQITITRGGKDVVT